jgi:hypothetical protein
MPAMIVDTLLALPRLPRMGPEGSVLRPAELVVTGHEHTDGVGILIRRPFPGELPLAAADPVLAPVRRRLPGRRIGTMPLTR